MKKSRICIQIYMNRLSLTLALSFFSIIAACAQDFSAILQSIEQHSFSLEASRQEAEAIKTDSRLENTLDDPEVGFGYLLGSNGRGNRKDVSIRQSFDFPTVYAQRARFVKEQQRVADLRYLTERQQLLLKARKLCIEVVYCNALLHHLHEDEEKTAAIAESYEKLYERGEATEIDLRKTHQAVITFASESRAFHAMRENLLAELQCMNGGEPVVITDTAFVHTPLSTDFDQWLADNLNRHPEMQLTLGQLEAERSALKVARGSQMPRLSLGYMAEIERDENYHGVTVGVSLPLWSAGKKVKAAKQHVVAAESREKEMRLHLATQLRGIYNDALQLQETYHQYAKHINGCDITPLLDKSLEKGQITLLTFYDEVQYSHDFYETLLATERDLELRKAELQF